MPRENFTYDTHETLTGNYSANIFRGNRHVIQSPAFDRHSDETPDQNARDWAEKWIREHP